jgi:hypothetical protein
MTETHEIEIMMFIHGQTDSAWRVSDTSEIADAIWIPKSQVDDGGSAQVGSFCDFLIPEWLASSKGLI